MFLYGGSTATLRQLERRLSGEFPGLRLVGAFSPPFGEMRADQDEAIVEMINDSGARIVWVGLGCPKQEAWMQAHRGRVNAVMIGVGAAFDFHAGMVKRAPLWMQRCGFEWLHRLIQEPQRLATRYLVSNTVFLLAALPDVAIPRRPR
jgi:N-acetylglucosaminyldiphosphoundecaprenol N-acetyl-beta-D-mannosaminyltransferase